MAEQSTYHSSFRPKPIAELLEKKLHFVIPSFQRGYRWERKQVLDLLEDILQFANDFTKGDSYFLQPIVLKPCTYQGKDAYEVLDGQQRLTTMLLILKRLIRRLSEDEREQYQDALYQISYTNRPQLDFDNPNPQDNIDSYYLAEAKKIINDWFKEKTDAQVNLRNFQDTLLYLGEYVRQVKVIWYETPKETQELTSIQTFNKLNKGKIELTSAELIKALFIMDYDLRAKGNPLVAERLSMEWNNMERKLQDDSFWYFISNKNDDVQNRMDLLFEFVTEHDSINDRDLPYREFQRLYDHCRGQADQPFLHLWAKDTLIRDMEDAWKLVKKTFDQLLAWYEDNHYYHYIGYLIATGSTPLKIHLELARAKERHLQAHPVSEWTQEDSTRVLRRMIMEGLKKYYGKYLTKEDLKMLNYEEHKNVVRHILLLFNIESYRQGGWGRFPFDKYKQEQWDIDHIRAKNNKTPVEEGIDHKINQLENLTLLDSSTNRECQDKPFSQKRGIILEKDRTGNSFIPRCTLNVFLKYYTDGEQCLNSLDAMRWNETDRANYLKAIQDTLAPILDSVVE